METHIHITIYNNLMLGIHSIEVNLVEYLGIWQLKDLKVPMSNVPKPMLEVAKLSVSLASLATLEKADM